MPPPVASHAPSQAAGAKNVLSHGAMSFVTRLVREFQSDIEALLEKRKGQHLIDLQLAPLTGDWKAAPLRPDLVDRRVEITGPPSRKMVINALNSGANAYMADFEDSCSPTWDNIVSGQANLHDAVKRTIEHVEGDKLYRLGDSPAVLMVRPRGLHMKERHVLLRDKPVPACLVDFGLYAYHNVEQLHARGSAPYFYLPKLESAAEAALWNSVFEFAQDSFEIERGTFKATVLIETLPAAFCMDGIVSVLRDHITGLNCGRWDYIFSFIKKRADDPAAVMPDRSQLTMNRLFLSSYAELLVQTCHRRGIHAMGGMAAQIPVKGDEDANISALAKVAADKLREAALGHDGTWVAHPALVRIAQEAFRAFGPNQIDALRRNDPVTRDDLLFVPPGECSEEGLRHNVRVGTQYLDAWLRGNGCVPLYGLMEDAATAEICRAQVWQWLRHLAIVGGRPLTPIRLSDVIDQERCVPQATSDLFRKMVMAPQLDDFLTTPAYDLLEEGR